MTNEGPHPAVYPHAPLSGHELIDCGHGEKLERFGGVVLRRPDPQAMWRPVLDEADWRACHWRFERESDRGGRWVRGDLARDTAPPEAWTIDHRGARFEIRPTPFKHVGLFPEQSSNWAWTAERVEGLRAAGDERPAVLNLFAYTGAATVMASRAGAFVTHVDASKPAMRWARTNAELSDLAPDAVRWIEDDAKTFVAREVRRGKRYRGVLLDPPPYGRGPKGEKWEFERDVPELLGLCRELLDDGPAFVALSCYAVGTTPLAFETLLGELGDGAITSGELALPQTASAPGASARRLPAGLCGRWRRD